MKNFILLSSLFLSLNSFAKENKTAITNQIGPTVTVASTQYLAQNLNRNYLLIQNNGATNVIVKFGSVQAGTEGVQIAPGLSYNPIAVPPDAVFIRSASATDPLTIIEGINP